MKGEFWHEWWNKKLRPTNDGIWPDDDGIKPGGETDYISTERLHEVP